MQSGHLGRARKFSRIWARPLFLSATVATLLAAPLKRWAAIFAGAGLLALVYCAFAYFQAYRYQDAQKRRFDAHPHREAPPHAGSAPSTPAGAPQSRYPGRAEAVALLSIPRIGLSSVVLEGAGAPELKLGPGHIPGTALPGEGGNFAVAGHRDTFFRPLRFIRVDDVVQVESLGRKFRCRVVSTEIVAPKDVQALAPTGRETLTLVTCYPFDFVGPAPSRFIVRADCESWVLSGAADTELTLGRSGDRL